MHRSRVLYLSMTIGALGFVFATAGRAQQQDPRLADSQGPARAQENEQPQSKEPPPTRFIYPTRGGVFVPLPAVPPVYDTTEYKIRVVTVANGLSRPFAMAFLPDGNTLITERTGRLRIVVNGVLDPEPIAGVPAVVSRQFEGLQDVALHPRFAENHLVYLAYTKGGPDGSTGNAVVRGRLDGHELKEVKEVYFVGKWMDRRTGSYAIRIAFDREGYLYVVTGAPPMGALAEEAQKPDSALGKVLRLRDDGTIPPDNPFVGNAAYRPEIFTLGHRNSLGLAVHPTTGQLFQTENGPQGGDELNLLKPGKNYGWPRASQGRDYGGTYIPSHEEVPGMERPFMYWVPAIATSGLMFYTGDVFPKWKGNAFVGSLSYNHLERLTFNAKGEPTYGREWLLIDLKQRIRDIRQGPDGNIYLLTDSSYGALLRIERAE